MPDKFQKVRLGDYVFDCQICGQRAWASEMRILSPYTGRGGLLVCKECNDPIDYGIVPYTIPAEKPVPRATDSNYSANPSAVPNTFNAFNTAEFDPLSATPQYAQSANQTWDKLTFFTWDQWTLPWGSPPEE